MFSVYSIVSKKNSGFDTHVFFSANFCKVDRFCDFLFDFLHIKHLLKRGLSKRNEFAPLGITSFVLV